MLFRRPTPPLPEDLWQEAVEGSDLLASLAPGDARRLREQAGAFLARKSLEPVQGLELAPGDGALIAALACLPVLELGLDAYDGWRSVVVYPGGFLARGHDVDEAGVVHEFAEPRSGEAWHAGPVILSLEDIHASAALDGYNVVLHEMAHKLDMLDGDANGRPPLHPGMSAKAWFRAFDAAFADVNAHLDAGREPPVDEYAGETPAEFFAVVSEYFFELPGVLAEAYPAVHEQLAAFYRRPGR